MWFPTLNKLRSTPLLVAAVLASGVVLAGCDEHVDVVRDHSVAIPKHATWAWAPAPPPEKESDRDRNGGRDRDNRPVISRDVITDDGREETVGREPRLDNETLRLAIRTDIEQTMRSKGFHQVDDPAAAEFLVDYHVGIRRHTVAVERGGYYGGGYPGFVCGPFGCWASYRWGYWGGPYGGYQNANYREGTIVFDMVKQGPNKVAFRAVGHKQLNNESFSADHVRDAVQRLLRDLKPGRH